MFKLLGQFHLPILMLLLTLQISGSQTFFCGLHFQIENLLMLHQKEVLVKMAKKVQREG